MQSLRSPRLRQRRKRRIIIRTSFIAFGLLLLISLPIILFHLPFWRISTVTVVGSGGISENDVRLVVEEKLSGSYVYLFPRSNIVLFPEKGIEAAILSAFPRAFSAEVRMTGLKSIEVSIVERKPEALWCRESGCYFLDQEGFVFDHSPDFSEEVYLVFSGGIEGDPIGKQYLSPGELTSVMAFVENVKNLSLSPVSVTSLAENEYEMKLVGEERVFWTTRMSEEETFANLQSLLSDPNLSLRDGNDLTVSSIDLRYGKKVYYKKKTGQ